MNATSSLPRARRFDGLSQTFHWLSLLLVAGQFASAWSLHAAGHPALLLTVHRSLGSLLWALTLGRALWRTTGARLPAFPAEMAPWRQGVAKLNEYGLYALLLAQPLTGLLHSLARGKPFDLFLWTVPALMARDKPLAALMRQIHEASAWALLALIALHALAALHHAVIRRDRVLQRMLPGGE
jgi:cytochrome b561